MPDKASITPAWVKLISTVAGGKVLATECPSHSIAVRMRQIFYRVRKQMLDDPEFSALYKDALATMTCKVYGTAIRFEPDTDRFDQELIEKMLGEKIADTAGEPVSAIDPGAPKPGGIMDLYNKGENE